MSVNFYVTDQCGNTSITTASIIQPIALSVVIAPPPAFNLYPTCAFGQGNAHIVRGFVNQVQLNAFALGGAAGYTYSWSPAAGLNNTSIPNPVFNPVIPQGSCRIYNFTVSVTDANGCVATAQVTVNVLNPQTPGTTPGKKYSICHGSQTLNVNANALFAHLGHHMGDCLGNCSQANGNCNTYMVEEPETITLLQEKMSVRNYPNPFTRTTSLFLTPADDDHIRIEVLDPNGRVIRVLKDEDVAAGMEIQVDFDGTNIPAGIYFYRIKTSESVYTGKFILISE
jgi:hypothetical protein